MSSDKKKALKDLSYVAQPVRFTDVYGDKCDESCIPEGWEWADFRLPLKGEVALFADTQDWPTVEWYAAEWTENRNDPMLILKRKK